MELRRRRSARSTVSKAVSRLERELDVKLLVRTTRTVAPTAAGRAYFDECAGPVATLDLAQRAITGRDRDVAGFVRLTAPEDYGAQIVSPAIAELVARYPRLSFEVRYTDQVLDLVRDGFDLAVRLGTLRASRLYARRLGESTLIAVASPSYIESAPRLRKPSDLNAHRCLAIAAGGSEWALRSRRALVRLRLEPRVVCNQMTSLIQMATRGAGIALVPSFLCRAEISSGSSFTCCPRGVVPAWPCRSPPRCPPRPRRGKSSSSNISPRQSSAFSGIHRAQQRDRCRDSTACDQASRWEYGSAR